MFAARNAFMRAARSGLYVFQANSGAYNTLTVASHAVGDLMLAMGWGANGSAVPVFTGGDSNTPSWTRIGTPANGCSMYYAIATKTNHSFGTWTNGGNMTSITIRGQGLSPIGVYSYDEYSAGNLTSSGTTTASTPLSGGTGSLMLYYGVGISAWTAATGFTLLHSAVAGWNIRLLSKDNPTTAPSGNIFGINNSSYWGGCAVEIK
jgi:hypothetical protein